MNVIQASLLQTNASQFKKKANQVVIGSSLLQVHYGFNLTHKNPPDEKNEYLYINVFRFYIMLFLLLNLTVAAYHVYN